MGVSGRGSGSTVVEDQPGADVGGGKTVEGQEGRDGTVGGKSSHEKGFVNRLT